MWNSKRPSNGFPMQQPAYAYNYGNAAPQQGNATPMVQMPVTHPQPAVYPQQVPPQQPPVQVQAPTGVANPQPQTMTVQPNQPANADDSYIDSTIARRATNKAAMDFSCRLNKAHNKDFANIHGCGGKDHAPNSSIRLTVCDYSKGTGDASVSASFNVDVRDISRLRCAAEAAITGTLGLSEQLKGVREFATANGIVIGWLQSNHQPTLQELAGLQQTLCNGLVAQDPENKSESKVVWSFEALKTNPYKGACKLINNVEHTPVSTLSVTYSPAKKYPWSLHVCNFMAPIVRKENGSSYSVNKQAVNKKEAIFPMTTEDFFCVLSDVEHYIALWEHRMYPAINAMCNERERRAAEKRQQAQYK